MTNHQLIQFLSAEPYMEIIKRDLKPIYMSEIQEAMVSKNLDFLEKTVNKYLSKKEAKKYLPLMIMGIQKFQRQKSRIKGVATSDYSKKAIIQTLAKSLDADQLMEVTKCLDSGNQDLCNTLLEDYLRFQEYQELLPTLRGFFQEAGRKDVRKEVYHSIERLCDLHSPGIIEFLKQGKTEAALKIVSVVVKSKEDSKKLISEIQDNFIDAFEQSLMEEQSSKLNQIKQNAAEIKQGRKMQIFDDLRNLLGASFSQQYNQIAELVKNGKLKKAEAEITKYLGLINSQKFIQRFRQFYEEIIKKPLLNSIFLRKNEDELKFYQIQTQEILEIPEDQITNVLFVGMTGVGKSTFLNSLANYFLGVEMGDDFRYIISKDPENNQDGNSSTTEVRIYGLPKQGRMKQAIRLIDIPGMADTQGIKKDREHLKMIKERIQKTVPFINLVIYVFKANETRITTETQYVINQTMSMFAKDIASNMLFVLTFADTQTPCALQSLKKSFDHVIKEIQKKRPSWFLKVNNSALFKKIDENEPVDVSFYMMGQHCLEKATQIIFGAKKISTQKSIQVMSKRELLETQVAGLSDCVTRILTKQSQIKSLIQRIANDFEQMDSITHTYTLKQEKIEYISTKNKVTTCLNCDFTCHNDCIYENQDKDKCVAMDKDYCKVCPAKCYYAVHKNDNRIINRVMVEVKKTNEQLYKKYNIHKESKEKNEQLLLDLFSDYGTCMAQAKQYCDSLNKAIQELKAIQLKEVNHATNAQYIQILIINEENNKKPGFENRIRQFKTLKRQEEQMQELKKSKNLDQFTKHCEIMKGFVADLITNKDLADKMIKMITNNLRIIFNKEFSKPIG